MLQPGGRNLAWKDAGNGKLTINWGADGNPKFDDAEVDLIFSLLLESPWFGDPLGKRRSLVPTVKTRDAGTPGRLKQYAEDALRPAGPDGDERLKSFSASVDTTATGYLLHVAYVTAAGRASAQHIPITG